MKDSARGVEGDLRREEWKASGASGIWEEGGRPYDKLSGMA